MRSAFRITLFVLAVILFAAGSIRIGHASSAPQIPQALTRSFSIRIAIVADEVKSGSDAIVRFNLTNTSEHEIDVPWIFRRGAEIEVDVKDAQGKRVRGLKEYIAKQNREAGSGHIARAIINAGSVTSFHLRPGQAMTQDLFVSDLYDLHQKGTYTIQVLRKDPEGGMLIKSNTAIVTVIP